MVGKTQHPLKLPAERKTEEEDTQDGAHCRPRIEEGEDLPEEEKYDIADGCDSGDGKSGCRFVVGSS